MNKNLLLTFETHCFLTPLENRNSNFKFIDFAAFCDLFTHAQNVK